MLTSLEFQRLFSFILSQQVEYSYGAEENAFTTMVPLKPSSLGHALELAQSATFAGDMAWSVERFARMVHPDELLLRLDWHGDEATAITLYCRFPVEPEASDFQGALDVARAFQWRGPNTDAVATALGVRGPRGIAFRASKSGSTRTAVYFRCEVHAGTSWTDRLKNLLRACHYPEALASEIEGDMKALYLPGPVGVIGLDEGTDSTPGAIKFDPCNVPLKAVLAFLARIGLSRKRLEELTRIAIGFRAESVTYASVHYGKDGFSGFRLYFGCEPAAARLPSRIGIPLQRTLMPARRLPHY